jgi:hypothetical protein
MIFIGLGEMLKYTNEPYNDDGIRPNYENFKRIMIGCVVMYIACYIFVASFSIFILLKFKNEFKTNKYIYRQFLFGLIPLAQFYTAYTSYKIIKIKTEDNPHQIYDSI